MNMRDKMVADARRQSPEPVPTGPFLDTSGERTRIIVPSPKRSNKLIKRMHAYGFIFGAWEWIRFTDQPLRGTVWSEKHWIELAEKCYREAYGNTGNLAKPAVVKPAAVKKTAKKVAKIGTYLQQDIETGLIRETSTLYKPNLFTEA